MTIKRIGLKNFHLESLSNNLCSLRPNEEKLTFSIIFTFNSNYEVKNYWFGRTVINSNQRFSYKEAQYIIENKSNIIPKEISLSNKDYKIGNEIKNSVLLLNDIGTKLREQRIKKGSILFNKKEVKFILNSEKEPLKTVLKETKEANKLVEEFMLLANKKVAEIFSQQKKEDNIYRVHD